MDREQQQPMPNKRQQLFALVGWVAFIAQVLAASVEPLIRRRFGERYLGMQAAAVLIVVPIYCLFWEGHDLSGMMIYLVLFLLACMTARIGITRRRRTGDLEHSYDGGRPDIMKWRMFRKISERTAKTIVEPIVVALFGVGLLPFSEPLGWYLMIAAGGLLISARLALGYQRTRLMDMRDARIDQRNIVERFREGDWR